MMFRVVFWDILPCKMIVDRRFRGAYCLHHQGSLIPDIPEDNSERDSLLPTFLSQTWRSAFLKTQPHIQWENEEKRTEREVNIHAI
jgi:hypothetical protein